MKLGFIGIGRIASALVDGFCTSGTDDLDIYLSPRGRQNAINLTRKYGNVHHLQNNQEVLDCAEIIFICMVPAVANTVLPQLVFKPEHTVISVVSTIAYNDIFAQTRPAGRVCRAIPLPPVSYHRCPIPVFNADAQVIDLLRKIGQPMPLDDEYQLHVLWALTGLITPYYELLGELSDWAVKNGAGRKTASRYIADMFCSLSLMACKTDPVNFNELAKHAATPNGMNEQAGRELREKQICQYYSTAADHLLLRFKK